MKRRMIAWVAVLCLIVGLLPAVALAADETDTNSAKGLTSDDPIEAEFDYNYDYDYGAQKYVFTPKESNGLICGNYAEGDFNLYGISQSWLEDNKPENGKLYIKVIIPKDVETIAPYCFANGEVPESAKETKAVKGAVAENDGSYEIVSVDFSGAEWLSEIGEYAFNSCSVLKDVDFSKSLYLFAIGAHAFEGCSGLTELTLSNYYYDERYEEYSYGSLYRIGNYAFANCTGLTSVDFSSMHLDFSYDYFGDHVFEGCTGLKFVNFALDTSKNGMNTRNDIENLGAYTFAGCTSLQTVVWPEGNLSSIGAHAFENCTSLRWICEESTAEDERYDGRVDFKSGFTAKIGAYAFSNCFAENLDVKLSLPARVGTIGEYAFASDRISQIYIGRQGNGKWDEGTFKNYDKTAFATGNDHLLIVLDGLKTFAAMYENGGLSTELKASIGCPITIRFKNSSDEEIAVYDKLYNQSLCYKKGEDGFWTYNESYKLPGITPPSGRLPTGYVIGYTISGAPDFKDRKTVYLDDSLLRFDYEYMKYPETCVMNPSDMTLAQPTITFSMDGVDELDKDELEYNQYGVPVFKVPLDGEKHTVGVQVDHDLLPSKVDDNASEYVYFRYCWWDEQTYYEDNESGKVLRSTVSGDRSQETNSFFSKETDGWEFNSGFDQLNRQETAYAEIPIRTSADSRTGDSQYMVEIYGYHVTVDGDGEQTEELFYKSHYNFIDFGSDNDTEATVGRCYTLQVETIESAKTYYDVTFDANGGKFSGDADTLTVPVEDGGTVTAPAAPKRDGYTFGGWYTDMDCTTAWDFETDTVTADTTLYAKWAKDNTGGGGGGTTWYTLTYDSNGGTTYPRESYSYGTTVQLDRVPTREGYQFTGWYADADLTQPITSIKMTGNKTVYAGWQASTIPGQLNGEDHFAYVVGYENGTVRPNSNISRAETATIFFRLLKDEVRDGDLTTVNTFEDVTEGMWCNTAISTMAELGIVKGRSADVFDPDANITRAEFAAICARFDTGITQGDSEFTDISGHWAEEEIKRAVSLGWLLGYEDGTFRPDQPITRAEAMTIINRVLCRIPESEDDLLPGMNVWPDNQPGTWYYLAVQEATNSHDYRHKGEIYETWVALTADPDWARYEK